MFERIKSYIFLKILDHATKVKNIDIIIYSEAHLCGKDNLSAPKKINLFE